MSHQVSYFNLIGRLHIPTPRPVTQLVLAVPGRAEISSWRCGCGTRFMNRRHQKKVIVVGLHFLPVTIPFSPVIDALVSISITLRFFKLSPVPNIVNVKNQRARRKSNWKVDKRCACGMWTVQTFPTGQCRSSSANASLSTPLFLLCTNIRC